MRRHWCWDLGKFKRENRSWVGDVGKQSWNVGWAGQSLKSVLSHSGDGVVRHWFSVQDWDWWSVQSSARVTAQGGQRAQRRRQITVSGDSAWDVCHQPFRWASWMLLWPMCVPISVPTTPLCMKKSSLNYYRRNEERPKVPSILGWTLRWSWHFPAVQTFILASIELVCIVILIS